MGYKSYVCINGVYKLITEGSETLEEEKGWWRTSK